ncbi:MAG: putative signal transduction protein [Sedimentibacter sp.]|jgi:EAL domain-containing protein (putative c-di-GMP-specific phosphodiesterase class I)/GGDEF domain-containing protein|nr:putative signal transduction protein [Sedimentibacter sp.]
MNKGILGIIKTSQEKNRVYEDITTGYFNSNKFSNDLINLVKEDKYGSISMIMFAFENMDVIKRYVDYEISIQIFVELHKAAAEFFDMGTIYTVYENKFAIVLPDIKIFDANNLAKEFILKTKDLIYIGNLPISIVVKAGIVNYPSHSSEAGVLIKMLDKSLDQASKIQNSIQIYNNIMDKEQEIYFSDLVSLCDALKNNMFSLAFQPIIDIQKNKISGAEALLRWNIQNNSYMTVSELIKRAEDAGFINEITRWLFRSVTDQLKEWKEKGIEIPVSMNLSSKDLADESFINYVKSYIEDTKLNPKYIEFELTERSIIDDVKLVTGHLKKLKSAGVKLSLDDFGAGFNSIKNLMDFAGKFDFLKIDKSFIDKILKDEKLIIVDCIIKAAHRLGMRVIAEGVEINEQVEILKTVDCDMIQGFYFSKPLTALEFEEYILDFTAKEH